jgi:RNA polymerase-interacting CarD/CdnL/TRCF family regulator
MEPQPSLAVGELVVYGAHGVGRVADARPAAEGGEELVVLEFEEGLRVTLPVERARLSVRAVASEAELRDVQRTLRGDGEASDSESWAKRFRSMQLKLAAGELIGVAEVVRDGIQREREHGARAGSALAPAQRILYLKARRLLAAEIAVALGIELTEAENWIGTQHSRLGSVGAFRTAAERCRARRLAKTNR